MRERYQFKYMECIKGSVHSSLCPDTKVYQGLAGCWIYRKIRPLINGMSKTQCGRSWELGFCQMWFWSG